MRKLPSRAHLQEWFDYDPDTGVFIWKKVDPSNIALLGHPAGSKPKTGYVVIGVPGFGSRLAHRLAWVYVHGITVGGAEIDHVDGNRSNNAISNLRLATSSQQKQNKRVQSNNRSGLKGAYYHASHKGKKWRSQIVIDVEGEKKLIFLGYFHTAEEAHASYGEAARKYFGEFARTS